MIQLADDVPEEKDYIMNGLDGIETFITSAETFN